MIKMSLFLQKKDIPNLINKITSIFVINEILMNVIISIKNGKTYLCLNYASGGCLLNPPLKQNFDDKPAIKFKNDLQKIIDNLLD